MCQSDILFRKIRVSVLICKRVSHEKLKMVSLLDFIAIFVKSARFTVTFMNSVRLYNQKYRVFSLFFFLFFCVWFFFSFSIFAVCYY